MEKYPVIVFQIGNAIFEHKITIKNNYGLSQLGVDTRQFIVDYTTKSNILLKESLLILFMTMRDKYFDDVEKYMKFLDENEIDFETLRDKAFEIVNNSLPEVKKETKMELDEDEKN